MEFVQVDKQRNEYEAAERILSQQFQDAEGFLKRATEEFFYAAGLGGAGVTLKQTAVDQLTALQRFTTARQRLYDLANGIIPADL